jgi:hypothetical protein
MFAKSTLPYRTHAWFPRTRTGYFWGPQAYPVGTEQNNGIFWKKYPPGDTSGSVRSSQAKKEGAVAQGTR